MLLRNTASHFLATGVQFHARSGQLIGLAMTRKDMATLHDTYQIAEKPDEEAKATSMLQFLWRCLSSPFDVIGPYYCTEGGLTSKFMGACVLETMSVFHQYGFKTKVIIGDGASTNLTLFKQFCGHTGAFPTSSRDTINASFDNPFCSMKTHYSLSIPSGTYNLSY